MVAETVFTLVGLVAAYAVFLLAANVMMIVAPYTTLVIAGVVLFVSGLTILQAFIVAAASYWPLAAIAIADTVTKHVRLQADGSED